jgi:hypothetical protein
MPVAGQDAWSTLFRTPSVLSDTAVRIPHPACGLVRCGKHFHVAYVGKIIRRFMYWRTTGVARRVVA